VRPPVLRWPDDDPLVPQETYEQPIWEDTEHVLVAYRAWQAPGEPANDVRLSVRDGTLEWLPDAGGPLAGPDPG
jgi:hypothetical protein